MNTSFTDAARALLEGAGWTPCRRVDVAELVGDMRAVGFDVSDAAVDFLEEFSQLRISHAPSIMMGEREIFCWTEFDPARVCTERDARIANRCSELVGESLCPVGTDGFHFTVYISAGRKFYAGMDASVYSYSGDAGELFSLMAVGVRPQHLADWRV